MSRLSNREPAAYHTAGAEGAVLRGTENLSGVGQKQTWRHQIAMSALPPIADIPRRNPNVRFGPITDLALLFFRHSMLKADLM
jgi:hypothetical protein